MFKLCSLFAAGIFLAIAAPASLAEAAPAVCTPIIRSVLNPATHAVSNALVLSCPAGVPDTSLTNPFNIGGFQAIASAAPPDSQFFEFSAPSSVFDVHFSGSAALDGSLSLYTGDDALVNSSLITAGVGELDTSGLTVGANYILDIYWDTVVDPTYLASFSAAVNPPTIGSVPEPSSLAILVAALTGLGLFFGFSGKSGIRG